MDKFGIFNLLNSFLNFNSNKTTQSQNDSIVNGQSLTQGLSNLFSSLNATPNAQNGQKPQPNEQEKPTVIPLQNAMLSTMSSHDEFVKRVKHKHFQK